MKGQKGLYHVLREFEVECKVDGIGIGFGFGPPHAHLIISRPVEPCGALLIVTDECDYPWLPEQLLSSSQHREKIRTSLSISTRTVSVCADIAPVIW